MQQIIVNRFCERYKKMLKSQSSRLTKLIVLVNGDMTSDLLTGILNTGLTFCSKLRSTTSIIFAGD